MSGQGGNGQQYLGQGGWQQAPPQWPPGTAPYGSPQYPPGAQGYQPGQQYAPPSQPPAPPRQGRPRRRRHVTRGILEAAGALIAIITITILGVHAAGKVEYIPVKAPVPGETQTVIKKVLVPGPTVTRRVTVAPKPASASAPTAAPAPATSSAPAPAPASSAPSAAGETVATFSGSGILTTPKFTTTGSWKLDYSFDCSSFGTSGNFAVYQYTGSTLTDVSVNQLGMGKSGSTYDYADGGTHYLEVNSECSWTLKVVDEGD